MLYRSGVGVSAHLFESVYLALAHRVKYSVLDALVLSLEACEQILHILALGCVILGAEAFDYGKLTAACKILHVLFCRVEKRSYKRYFSIR